MRQFIIALLLLFVGVSFAEAQGTTKISNSKKRQLADALMEAGSYYNARDYYLELYENKPTPALEFRLGEAYYKSRDYKNALTWYQKAWTNSPGAYPDAQYYYALCMKMNGQYKEAETEFKNFRTKTKMRGAESTILKKKARNEEKGCKLAELIMSEPIEMEINPMGRNINAAYTEFSPMPISDDEFIYASLRTDSVINMGPNRKTTYRSQLYKSKRNGDSWSKGSPYDDTFNGTEAHTGNGSFSPDGQRFYFTECTPDETMNMICNILMSEYTEDGWSKPREVKGVNIPKYTSTHPTIGKAKGKEVLYFASNRPGTVGGMDIFYSEITNDGKDYARPRNCGRKLNTVGDEITPFYNVKEDLLYFSSNGHINIGGHDVFKVSGMLRSWKTPLNVGYPINSNVDDMYFVPRPDNKGGFLVSNRSGAIALKSEFCCDDIFAFDYIFPPEFVIMGNVYEKGAEPKKAIPDAFVRLVKDAPMDSTISSVEELYSFYLGTDKGNYSLTSVKEGYLEGKATASTMTLTESDTLYVDIYMDPIRPEINIEVKDIYYALDKDELRPESVKGLDSLYNILTTYPSIKVELSAHTDSRGSDSYNQDLSQRRAQSVVNYLVNERGINPIRLVPRGYGESQLKNQCSNGVSCSEEEHQLNRRTEIRVLGQIEGAVIKYDQAQIDAMRALNRDRGITGGIGDSDLDSKIEQLMDREELEELAPDDAIDPVVEEVRESAPAAPSAPATLDAGLKRSGTSFAGSASVNGGAPVDYLIDLRVPVVMVSPSFFATIQGGVTDYMDQTPVSLPDGTTTPGSIFIIDNLQLGDETFTNVEAKINTRIKKDLVVGRKTLESNGCTVDSKKLKLKCK